MINIISRELIGIEYLYQQNGQALQDFKSEECSQMLEEVTVEDEEDEGCDDIVDETMGTLDDENLIKTKQTLPVQSLVEKLYYFLSNPCTIKYV